MQQAEPAVTEEHAAQPASSLSYDLLVRLGALGSLAAGVGLGWFLIMRPLEQARAGAAQVSMSINGAFVLVPLLLVLGIVYLIGGEKVRYRDTSVHPPRPLFMFWVIMILLLAIGGGLFWYTEAQLAALGYR
jgi:hypothetical protein